ncbi:hypothetical protein ACOSQ4_007821 [Xanthoceras sorbifolium]
MAVGSGGAGQDRSGSAWALGIFLNFELKWGPPAGEVYVVEMVELAGQRRIFRRACVMMIWRGHHRHGQQQQPLLFLFATARVALVFGPSACHFDFGKEKRGKKIKHRAHHYSQIQTDHILGDTVVDHEVRFT